MTESSDDVTERNDPVLVRPYVSAGGEEDRSGDDTWPRDETWPSEDEAQPGEAEARSSEEKARSGDEQVDETAQPEEEQPRPADRRSHSPHWSLRLLVLLLGVVTALGIAAYFVLGGGSREDAHRAPSVSLPAVGPAAVPAVGAVTSAAKPSGSATHSPTASAPPSVTSSSTATPSATEPPSRAPVTTKPTLAAPPASDRTGPVGSASGRCLALGGLLAIDGSPIQTASCSGGTSQKFTLATDGTLRVAGRCATAGGDGSVRSDGCGGAGDGGQWRAGPNGSLVNPSTGRCLTDTGRAGAATEVEACTGGRDQQWRLP